MTVNTNTPLSGPHLADGVNKTWQFNFKIMDGAHLRIVVMDEDGDNREEYLTNFSVDDSYIGQDNGGYVTFPVVGDPVADGRNVFVARNAPYHQPQRIGNQGGYYPKTHEDTFDLLEMQIQQLNEKMGRAVTVNEGDGGGALAGEIFAAAESAREDADRAEVARDYAREWASSPEDVPVNDQINPPGYSAYHYMKKAQAIAVAALINVEAALEVSGLEFPLDIKFLRTAGYSEAGDGGGALYRRSDGYEKNVAKNPKCDDPAIWIGGSVGLGTWAVDDGLEVIVSPPIATTARIYQAISLVEGRQYKLVYTISGLTSGRLRSMVTTPAFVYPAVPRDQDGTYEEIFTAPAGVVELAFRVWDANVNVGARINNVYLYEEATAADVGGIQSADGSWWVLAEDVVNPLQLGAKGDGAHDDTAALSLCMSLGVPIDWLGDKYRYRITSQITYVPEGVVDWQGRGATLFFDPPSPLFRMISIDQLPLGGHKIEGLVFRINDKGYQGLGITAGDGQDRSLRVNCEFYDARKHNTAYEESASGLRINGAYKVVDISGTKVDGCRISVDAGVPGYWGAHGIAIRAGNGRPQLVIADGIHIENVECDDLDNFADRDGLLVWTDRNAAPNIQQETALIMNGAFFKNCLSRSVKVQIESANIDGIRVIRMKGNNASNVGVDIDLQIGGGRISGFSAIYDGANSAPARAIILGQTDEVAKPCAVGHVDGVEIAMSNGASMESVIQTGLRRGGKASYRMQNITVEGGTVQMIARLAGKLGAEQHLSLRGVTAAPTLSFVRATNGPASGTVLIDDIVNTGLSPVPAYTRVSSAMAMRVSVGFAVGVSENKSVTDNALGAVERISAIAPLGAGRSGVMRPVSVRLGNGEQFLFPESFVNARSGILIITTSTHRNGHGIFAVDGTGVVLMHQSAAGSEFTVGSGSEPVSGNYRLWATVDGARLSNHSGSARTFTCWMLG